MNSPKCIPCLEKNLVAQTYKVAGKSYFKCHDCQSLYERGSEKLKYEEPIA